MHWSLLNFTKSRLARISLKYLVVYKSGWTQENPSQSYLIDKYDTIWYDMIWNNMVWYDISLIHNCWNYFSAEMRIRARHNLQNIFCSWFSKSGQISSGNIFLFLDHFRGYFAEGYLVVIAILWECYFHISPPNLLYLSVTFIIPPADPFSHFTTKSHIALNLWLLKIIVSCLWPYALSPLLPVDFEMF